jgi:hypothetical protein
MRWKTIKHPEANDRRERVIFALVPRRCVDGFTRWLCFINVTEEWKCKAVPCDFGIMAKWMWDEVSAAVPPEERKP